MWKSYLKPTVFTVVILIRSMVAHANNIAILSGNWETPTNWSTGAVPLATDAVVIPAGITMTVAAAGDVCASLSIINLGTLTISANQSLSIGGNFTNAGTFTATAGSTLTFNGASNSIISGGGSYTIAGTIVMNMGSTATTLDVQDANFITGINSGAKYYFTFTKGTWIEDNTATLSDSYNSGSATSLTIPFGVVIQSNAGTMNLARKATSGQMLLSGELFLNGGTVNVQTGQALNAGYDFKYSVNGGTPQLYISSGTLYVGGGFNPNANTDYIDFHMTGGTMIVAEDGYSSSYTFLLNDKVGGKTFMSAGTIILQDACNAPVADLDMGGANVAATQYSVTGGTVQIGYSATQAGATFFGIQAEPATNYPNILFQSGVAKTVGANNAGQVNMLSLYINSNMTFNASGFTTVNIMSNNGTFAFDDEGTYTTGNSTMEFSGAVNQLITSTSLANVTFKNLMIANTSGNVTLGVNATVSNQLSFTSGLLDASKKTLTLSTGSVPTTGASATRYVIVGNGFNTFGNMTINNLPTASSTPFPIGTASYYLPAAIQPVSAGTNYSAFVFTGATTNGLANGTLFSAPLLANMFSAVWNIGQTAGSGSATINLGWAASGVGLEGGTFASAGTSIGIIQNTGGTAWNTPAGSGSVAGMTATASFSSFTKFAITDLMFVLPVVVSNFNAVAQNDNTALVSWSASDVADVSRFDVQRSTDGSNFTTIGTVDASAAETSYSLTDTRPASGVNYYRLLTENTDGAQMFSTIRTVDFSSDAGIRIYPVPASTTVNVSLGNAGSGISVRLISVTGQLLQSATVTGSRQVVSMNISNYPAGAYFVQVIGENRILQTTTVSKL
ncbi:MAG TPA: T9SS type A sorting domain-containing protein [Puia sp.]|nr:T9SS type A sorting domain-containing protein [Puia sp.]